MGDSEGAAVRGGLSISLLFRYAHEWTGRELSCWLNDALMPLKYF